MTTIKEKRKILLQEFKSQDWLRQFKTWDLGKKLTASKYQLISLAQFKVVFSKLDDKVKIYTLANAPARLKSKFLKYYQAEGKLDKYLLATAKNHFIVDIKATDDVVINWRNSLISSQVVFFLVSGQGKVEIMEEQKSDGLFVGQAIIVEAQSNSQVIYTLLIKKNKGLSHLYYRAYLNESAQFKWQTAINNKAIIIGSLATVGRESGSQSYQLLAGKFTDSSQTSLLMINNHQGEYAQGDMVFKGLGDNNARVHVEGVIRIGKDSKYSNSYLQEDIILLDKKAKVTAVPNLEILNNEVKASHGATVGKIDERAVFYLMSRGLDADQARNLILTGFFKTIIGRIDNRVVKEKFEKILI